MDTSWFLEFVGFVRENWPWCVTAVGILYCLHHFMGNSDDSQIENSQSSSRSCSTGNNCVTTVSPVINVPCYSVSDQNSDLSSILPIGSTSIESFPIANNLLILALIILLIIRVPRRNLKPKPLLCRSLLRSMTPPV